MRPLLALALLAGARASRTWRTYNDTNACTGSLSACVNTTGSPFQCLGSFPDAAACGGAAAALPQWSFSPRTNHCWTRTDGAWLPEPAPGMTAACDDARLAACTPPAPPAPTTALTATVGAARIARTHALHPAVSLDMWRLDGTHGRQWGNASALTIDLASPALRAAAAALAPAILRIGGSPEDGILFDDDGTCAPQSGGAGPFAGYYCSQVTPYVYDCLTRARWAALLEFAAATGLKIAFGLNGCVGRASPNASMDYANAKALFAATAASPHAAAGFWGFELSNEVVPTTITPAAWAADAVALKAAAAAAFAAAGLPPPPLVGPDGGGCCASQAEALAATTPGTLAAITYHSYPDCEADAAGVFALTPACLHVEDLLAGWAAAAAGGAAPGAVGAWLGEGADHVGGGVRGLTDTFRSSFYVAWLYGAAAAAGVELTVRQCLSGGDYELLQRNNSFAPNPDYWTVWLFHALVGGAADVFNVTASAPPASGVRVFAFSAAAGTGATTALLAINLQLASAVSVTLAGALPAGARTEFHLTGNLTEPHGAVACNGAPLALDPATHAPLPARGLGVPAAAGSPLTLAPASFAFVLL
jgi:heparanase 1